MVLTYLSYNLSGPYSLVNKLIPIINTYNEINRSPKKQWLVFSNIEIEEKGIFIVRIQTKR